MLLAIIQHGEAEDEISSTIRRRWQNKVDGLQVVGKCDCGDCPSVSFTDDEAEQEGRIILSASVPDALVLLFIADDQPEYLELAPVTDKSFDEFPAPEELILS